MVPANVKLSKNELLLVCDEAFILTKNNIIEKVYKLFGLLATEFSRRLTKDALALLPEVWIPSAKIYKGENYLLLPYVMLDYPRFFNRDDVFAIRCFFWWGNFFSITLHLTGKYAAAYHPKVIEVLSKKEAGEWYYCINQSSQWEHHYETNNYLPFTHNTFDNLPNKNDFFKVAAKIPLQQWDDAYDFFVQHFTELLTVINEG